MTASARRQLEDLVASMQSKEFIVNENNRRVDAWFAVKSRTSSGPPGSPAEGDAYIVDSATGDWSSFSVDDIAYYQNEAWMNLSPTKGPLIYLDTEDLRVNWDGTNWVPATAVYGVNTQTISYTTVLGDAFKRIRMNSGSATTLTVDEDANVPYALGSEMVIRRTGAGAVTVAGAGSVAFNGSITLAAQNDAIQIVLVATDVWDVYRL